MNGSEEPAGPPPDEPAPEVSTPPDGGDGRPVTDGGRDEGDEGGDADTDADATGGAEPRSDDGGFVFGGARDRPAEGAEPSDPGSDDPDETDGESAASEGDAESDPDGGRESGPSPDRAAGPTDDEGTVGRGDGDDGADDAAGTGPSDRSRTDRDDERSRTDDAADGSDPSTAAEGHGADDDVDGDADAATGPTDPSGATQAATTAASPTGSGWGDPDAGTVAGAEATADRRDGGLRGLPVVGGLLAAADDYPVAWSLVVAVGLALVALAVGFALVFGSLLGLGAAGIAASPTVQIVTSLLLFQGVTMGGVAAVYLSARGLGADYVGLSLRKVFGDPIRDVLAVVVAFVVALGAAFGGAVVVSTFGVQAGTNQAADLAFEDPEVLLFLIPGAFLLIGPGEELLFRGVIQSRLRETIGRWPAVVVGAALFAAVHVTALSGGASARLVSITILFFPSLVFGAAYEFTDNLAVPALVHGSYNALIFTVLYLTIKFADLSPDAVQSGLVWPL